MRWNGVVRRGGMASDSLNMFRAGGQRNGLKASGESAKAFSDGHLDYSCGEAYRP